MLRYIIPALFLLSACTSHEDKNRIAQLEKEVQALTNQIKTQEQVADFDLDSKCAAASKVFFRENWSRDELTLLLD